MHRIYENTRHAEQDTGYEEMSDFCNGECDVEYQEIGDLQIVQQSSSKETAAPIKETEQTSHYTELLSTEVQEHIYASISEQEKLQKTTLKP